MMHAIVLGFGFCVGVVLFKIVGAALFAALTAPRPERLPKPPRPPKTGRREVAEWLLMLAALTIGGGILVAGLDRAAKPADPCFTLIESNGDRHAVCP